MVCFDRTTADMILSFTWYVLIWINKLKEEFKISLCQHFPGEKG